MRHLRLILIVLGLALLPAWVTAQTQNDSPQAQLATLNRHIAAARAAVAAANIDQARTEYLAFDSGWFEIEDGIRDLSRQSYRDIENAMGDVKFALKQQPVDSAKVDAALQTLETANTAFINGTSSAAPPTTAATNRTLAGELPKLVQR